MATSPVQPNDNSTNHTAAPSNGFAEPISDATTQEADDESRPASKSLSPAQLRTALPKLAQQMIASGKSEADTIAELKRQAENYGRSLSESEARTFYEQAKMTEHSDGSGNHYFIDKLGRLMRERFNADGDQSQTRRLANFHLTSIRTIVRDDGAETYPSLQIEAKLGGRTFKAEISIDDFQGMKWPMKVMGSKAVVEPKMEHAARYGLQVCARQDSDKLIYTHTGWRNVDGKPCYLHSGGAIGAEGIRSDIKATLPTSKMSAYTLPDPPTGEDEKTAIRASLRFLDVADDLFSMPLYAAIWRAPLGDCAMTVFIDGATGLFKTATAKLAQQHYGKDFEDEQNILHFDNGTANGFRETLFAAKDTLCLIDEFVPTGSTSEQQRMHAMGEQVIRAVGNKSGRIRLGKDHKLENPHEPRGLLITTGEGRPRGHSLAARTVHLPVTKETVNRERLTACQNDARMGLYAQAMAGYLRWLARQGGIGGKGKTLVEKFRQSLSSPDRHAKSAHILADLAVGFQFFLDYVVEIGAITSAEADALWDRLWKALFQLALEQDKVQSTQDPAREVLIRLKSAEESRKIFLFDPTPDAGEMEDQQKGFPHDVMDIGCKGTDKDGAVIEWHCNPDALYAAIVKLYREQNSTLPWDKATLWERLAQRGYTKTNEGRPTYRTGGYNRKRVICIPAEAFAQAEADDDSKTETSDSSATPKRQPAA